MSFAITSAAIGVVGAGAQIYSGIKQRRKASQIRENAVDPGIQKNYALDRVSNTLFQNYANWNLPGYDNYVKQVQANQASSNNMAMIGSTSSADILNSITANQAQADQDLQGLALQTASGRERALLQYLDSVQQQGQDQLRMNQEQRARYDATLREAAAYEGAGAQNMWNGFQEGLMATGALAQNFIPRQTVSQATGEIINIPSAWESYRNRRKQNSRAGNVYGPNSAQLTYKGLTA